MIVLTDAPAATDDVLPPSWRPVAWQRSGRRDAPARALWEVLGGGAPARWTEAPPAAEGFWSYLVVVRDAPASQFDVLGGQLADVVRDSGPVACLALEGRHFHGRRGRPWNAVAGNLHLSAAVPVRLPAATHSVSVTMVPAVAVVDAIARVTGGRVAAGIKWVNDILVDERKIAGVLAATHVLGDDIDLAVVGIGVNVAVAPAVPPTPFVPSVGFLRQGPGGEHVTLGAMLWAVLDALAARWDRLRAEGPAPLFTAYRRASLAIGRRVRIWTEDATDGHDMAAWPPPFAAGLVVDVGDDLAVSLHGRREPVRAGRLAFEEACEAFGLRHSD